MKDFLRFLLRCLTPICGLTSRDGEGVRGGHGHNKRVMYKLTEDGGVLAKKMIRQTVGGGTERS